MMIMKLLNKLKSIFVESKPEIIWWNTIPNLEKIHPLQRANKHIPQWFKDTSINIENEITSSNVKKCPSFPLYFNRGWIITLWCDLLLERDELGKITWTAPSDTFQFDFHTDDQFKNYLPDNIRKEIACVVKPICPWRVKTSKDWYMLQLPLFYEFQQNFSLIPGIFPSDIYHQMNQQIVVYKSAFKDSNKIMIPKGTPLAQYIPIPKKDIKGIISEETKELKDSEDTSQLFISTLFRNRFNNLKKCPYVHNKEK